MQQDTNLSLRKIQIGEAVLRSSLLRIENPYLTNNSFIKAESLSKEIIKTIENLLARIKTLNKTGVSEEIRINLVTLTARDIEFLESLRVPVEQTIKQIKENLRSALNKTGLALAAAIELERKDLVGKIILKMQRPLEQEQDSLKALENQLNTITQFYKRTNRKNPDYFEVVLKEIQIETLSNSLKILMDILQALFLNDKTNVLRRYAIVKNEIDLLVREV